jgi:hypothetical protein
VNVCTVIVLDVAAPEPKRLVAVTTQVMLAAESAATMVYVDEVAPEIGEPLRSHW